MTLVRVVIGGLVAVATTAALVGVSQVPWTASAGDGGELRLAWRWRSERVERCRRRSAEELARLPVHMRKAEVCERGLRPYALRVTVDGRSAALDTVRAAGAEADRPLSVFRRLPLAPGRYSVSVSFEAVAVGSDTSRSATRTMGLDTTVVIAPRRVVLVTLDEDTGRLVIRTAPPAS